MSDTHVPQTADTQVYSELPHPPEAAPKKMSTFLKVSIILLIGLTIASISLLFIGDFEGRFERVFSTFALFAVFVVFTAIDTSRERKSEWYAPVALIANTYILGLLLIVIWITRYNAFSLIFEIFWKSLLVIIVTRLVIICCELLLRSGAKSGGATNSFAFITSVLAVLSGILFTAPVGIEAFELEVPDLYWKIATAVLILTALGLSVTLLLRWAGSADDRAMRRAAAESAEMRVFAGQPYGAQQQAQQYPAQQQFAGQQQFADQQGYAAQQQYPTTPTVPAPAAEPATRADAQAPEGSRLETQGSVTEQPTAGASATDLQPEGFNFQQRAQEAQQAGAQEVAEPEGELLPWPTFADGSPIPADADGQPDFSVPGAPQPPQ